jgi:hypothetical protein
MKLVEVAIVALQVMPATLQATPLLRYSATPQLPVSIRTRPMGHSVLLQCHEYLSTPPYTQPFRLPIIATEHFGYLPLL